MTPAPPHAPSLAGARPRPRRGGAGLGLVLLLAALVAVPAHATPTAPQDRGAPGGTPVERALAPAGGTTDPALAAEAAVWVIEEVTLLGAAGAFTPHPVVDEVLAVVDPDVGPRAELLDELREVDALNEEDLAELVAEGWGPAPAVADALARLDTATWARLDAGDRDFLDPTPWLDAGATLLVAAGLPAPSDGTPPPHLAIVRVLRALPVGGMAGLQHLADEGLASAGDRAPLDATGSGADAGAAAAGPQGASTPGAVTNGVDARGAGAATTPTASSGGSTRWLALAALAAAAGLAVARRDRRATVLPAPAAGPPAASTDEDPIDPRVTQLLESSRRLTSALDDTAVHRIAARDAAALLGAADAAFLVRDEVVHWHPVAAPRWFPSAPQEEPWLARALTTGQAQHAVLTGWRDEPTAALAAPVLVDGVVVGVIVAVRGAELPFGERDLATAGMLTPLVGSALRAARTHHGALTAADVDGLTQLHNRRRLDADMASITPDADVAVAMVDVDHFKHFNDGNGHAAGDLVLQLVARALAAAVRQQDVVYRYGGEEFTVLLHGCDEQEAMVVMGRVREAVAALEVPGGAEQPLGRITVSTGVAVGDGSAPVRTLCERADGALYAAKAAGRDRVAAA